MTARFNNLPQAYVVSVNEGGAGDKAGITSDVIIGIQPIITTYTELTR